MYEQTIITVPGKPSTGGPMFTKRGFAYTPKNVAEWKAYVKLTIADAVKECIPKHRPVELIIIVRKPRPKSPKKPTADRPCPWAFTVKPDVDNVTKGIADAVKTIGFSDDNQVTDLVVRKRWGPVEEVEVRFRELSEEEMLELGE